jgi:hypothetical protein
MFSWEGVDIVEYKQPVRTVAFPKSWLFYSRGPVLSNHIGLTLIVVTEMKVYWPYVVSVGNCRLLLYVKVFVNFFFGVGYLLE